MLKMNSYKTIIFFLSFTLVSFGCATSQNIVSAPEPGLKAEAVSEGICLTFGTIPEEAARLFVHFQYLTNEDNYNEHNLVSSFSDLRGSSLEYVKQAGKVIFPIVQEGREYFIAVNFQDENFNDLSDWLYTDCIANKGIYLNNDLTLRLNERHSGVTLSSEPTFSSDVIFDTEKYYFGVYIQHKMTDTDSGSIAIGSHHIPTVKGLTWVFDPEMAYILKENEYLERGTYLAYVTARCNIIYDNIKWSVEIAKTPEFVYTL